MTARVPNNELLEVLRDLVMGGGGVTLGDRDELDAVQGLALVPPAHTSPQVTFTTGFRAAIDPYITALAELIDPDVLRTGLGIPRDISIQMSPYLAAQLAWLVVEPTTFSTEDDVCRSEIRSARESHGYPTWLAHLLATTEVSVQRLEGRERLALVCVPQCLCKQDDDPAPPMDQP